MHLRRVLVLRSANSPPGPGTPDDPHHVALHGLGLDLVGPLKKAPGGYTHLLVTIDKFTKWIEARPISMIKSEKAMLFFLNIIHRFGVSNSITMDNGT